TLSATVRLALLPRDGCFCTDGRGWHTSASGRGHGLDWPWPSTVLGALRTAWGRGEESRTGQTFDRHTWRERTAGVTLGRTLVLRRPPGTPWGREHRLWPKPADAVCMEGDQKQRRLEPLRPRLPSLGRDDDEARELLWVPELPSKKEPLRAEGWWSEDRFTSWLAGGSVPAQDPANLLALPRRVQVHVGIRPEQQTADAGVLFSHDVLETLEAGAEWAIGLEGSLPAAGTPAVVTLGSDRRLAWVEVLPELAFDPPETVMQVFRSGSAGLRLFVVSPASFQRGWLPDGIRRQGRQFRGQIAGVDGDVVLRAAMVSRPLHVSGWDMAASAPKSTSRMVPPSAVYFFEREDGRQFGESEARTLWLGALGSRTQEGFGRMLPGVWSPRRSAR
ncbi:MAG: type III-B CRISPR module-associated Cmr3 family protein, partial [Acidobacteriota bacterium]